MTALLLKWGAAAALFAALLGGIYAFAAFERASGAAMCRAEVEQAKGVAIDAAIKAVRKEEADKRKKVEESHAEDIKLADARIAAESDARLGLERLLARLRNRPATAPAAGGDPAPGPSPDGACAATGELLGACAARYVDVAAEAGRLAGQVTGLQGYVCAIAEIEGNSPVGERPCAGSRVLVTQPTTAPPGELLHSVAPPIEASP